MTTYNSSTWLRARFLNLSAMDILGWMILNSGVVGADTVTLKMLNVTFQMPRAALSLPSCSHQKSLCWAAKLHQSTTTGLKQSYFPSENLINIYKMVQSTDLARLFYELTHGFRPREKQPKNWWWVAKNQSWVGQRVHDIFLLIYFRFIEMFVWRNWRRGILLVWAWIIGHNRKSWKVSQRQEQHLRWHTEPCVLFVGRKSFFMVQRIVFKFSCQISKHH